MTVGTVLSFNVVVLFDCVVDAAFPAKSYIEVAEAGTTESVSEPSGVPLILRPRTHSLWLVLVIVDGVALIVTVPSVIARAKSATSKLPVPPFVL